ncbi:hypothetical protein GIB67_000755 [Kingdonia uniflora]|uniref:Uncharacterized protein n=1 Tax=Kingdonia uniflora TaxID=39325 RepID=A0A7J7ND51_9MAGN|nr:hypothetical protein GIB67_000755 [Kingdonia uniflora]
MLTGEVVWRMHEPDMKILFSSWTDYEIEADPPSMPPIVPSMGGIIKGSSSCNKAHMNGRGYARLWSNLARNEAMFPLTMLSWKVESNTSLDGVWKSVKAMAQKNSDNRANLTCHPKTGRKKFAHLKAKNNELAKLQSEADEKEAQHQQEIKNVKAFMNITIQVGVKRLMQITGIPFPDNN